VDAVDRVAVLVQRGEDEGAELDEERAADAPEAHERGHHQLPAQPTARTTM
jgi:hypothetical protein